MKRYIKGVAVIFALILLIMFSFTGCGGADDTKGTTGNVIQSKTQSAATQEDKAKTEPVYIEWWRNNQKGVTWEKDGPMSKWFIEKTGVGLYSPLVIWDGGEGYFSKLQTRIATNDLPDVLMPVKGVETSLIGDGMIWDLTDYLPKYAPNIWSIIPESVWNIVKTSDPTGKGGIYYIPNVTLFNDYGTFIRKDWLDKLGMDAPTTQKEYVEVLRAFRDKDPNGNGENDEIPTIGREFGRWMDHLFFMYDVAMYEGLPQFDLYNGELTYSAVTPNMKEAIKFIQGLYKEKLLDSNTFLNKATDLWGSVTSDKVGSWFHIPKGLDGMALFDLKIVAPKADVVVLPRIAAEGYNGYISNKQIWGPLYAFGKKDEKILISALKLMDWIMDDTNMEEVMLGVPGVHHTVKDGKKVKIQIDENVTEKTIGRFLTTADDIKLENKMNSDVAENDVIKDNLAQTLSAFNDAQKGQGKVIASDGMPSYIFNGFSDIQSHKLYQEYMTKMIIGEMSIDRFDEFVSKWNSSGGEEVTRRAREWYMSLKK